MFRKSVTQTLVSVALALLVCVPFVTGCAPPETVIAPPAETTPSLEKEQVIKDLAYIKILVLGYGDDADPEDDGISLDILYYDSKGEPVDFYDIPVLVTIELYGYRDVFDFLDHEKMEFVCKTQVTVDHSMRLTEMFGKYIRIPFENIPVNHSDYLDQGTMKVVVTTPKQGEFEAIQDLVWLYPKD
jgi:hypothetical protein